MKALVIVAVFIIISIGKPTLFEWSNAFNSDASIILAKKDPSCISDCGSQLAGCRSDCYSKRDYCIEYAFPNCTERWNSCLEGCLSEDKSCKASCPEVD